MNGSAARFHASGCSVVDFTNYTLASMQKAFSNREAPIGNDAVYYYRAGVAGTAGPVLAGPLF